MDPDAGAGTGRPVACPGCGTGTSLVHSYHQRVVADVPLDARRVWITVGVRRLRCPVVGCVRQTFREQLPGVLERYQRRTARLAHRIGAVVWELAGRAGARVLSALAIDMSRHTAIRMLLRLPLPEPRVPRVLGVDDFALAKRRRYATILIDAETRQRIDVLPDRHADTLEAWLRAHPGVQLIYRDGSGAYSEAIRRAMPQAVQVGDRWHIYHNLVEAVLKQVAAHSTCWASAGPPIREGKRAANTLLHPHQDNAARLEDWITAVRAADLPHLHAFTSGLDFDEDAVRAAVALPFHNGGAEGVNTKTKRIMRQMQGRAGFALLRHRILLG